MSALAGLSRKNETKALGEGWGMGREVLQEWVSQEASPAVSRGPRWLRDADRGVWSDLEPAGRV